MHSVYTAHENPLFQLALFFVVTVFYLWLASVEVATEEVAIAPPVPIAPAAAAIVPAPKIDPDPIEIEDVWEIPVIPTVEPEPVEVATTKPKARRPRQPRRAK